MSSVRVRLVCGVAAGLAISAAGSAFGQGARTVAVDRQSDRTPPAAETTPAVVTTGARVSRVAKIDRYAKVLGFDETQLEVARDLNTAYERSAAEAARAMQASMKDAQADMNDGDHAAFQQKLQKTMKTHGEASKALSAQFLSDLKALLRPDQEVNWVKLERLRRRERLLGGMFGIGEQSLGGAGVDLTSVVGRLETPESAKPKVDELLGLYEVDIDRPLQERERNAEEDEATMGAIRQFTSETFRKQQERDRAVDLKVREVNDKYVRLIGAELPEDLAAKLADEYRAKSFRSAYRQTSAGRELAAAERLKGLSPSQREQLKAMHEKYTRDTKAAGDRLAAAMRRAQDEGKSIGGPMMIGPGGQNEIDPQVAEARALRRGLDTALRESMEKLLSPDQLADARESAKPQGVTGQRIEVFGTGHGDDVVFASEIELDDDFEPGEGGGAMMIIQTVETSAPAQTQSDGNQPK